MGKSAKQPRCKRLSGRGQIVIPRDIRERHGWTPGMKLIVEDHGDSVVLRRAEDLPETSLEDLVGCAGYTGAALSLEEMDAAIAEGASRYSRSSSDSPVRRSSGS